MTEIDLKTLCIAIQAAQYEMRKMENELKQIENGMNEKNYSSDITHLQISLYDHDLAADVLKSIYIEKQKGVINFSDHNKLIRE